MSPPALNSLVTKIRAAYPGAYDDMDDATLTKSVLAKYPQYSDLAAPPIQRPQIDMQTSGLGMDTSTVPNPKTAVAMSGDDPSGVTGSAIAGITGAGAAATAAAPVLGAVASKYPWVWKAAKTLAASEAIGQARKIPYAGKLIPPGSEILPFLGLGGKEAAAESAGTEAAAGAEAPAGAAALGDVPTPATQPAAQTGEALATVPSAPWRMKPQAAALSDTPPPSTARQFTNKVGPMIDEGLGNTQPAKPVVNPGQPIYRRIAASTPPVPAEGSVPTGNIPEGHTAVEGSSAVKSFMYDPEAQEMHIAPTKGYTYVYGDVSPDQAMDFQNADSKGTAWGTIRNSSPLVAKIHENGTRTAMTPANTGSGEDLTRVLQQSVDAAKTGKWKMKAAP